VEIVLWLYKCCWEGHLLTACAPIGAIYKQISNRSMNKKLKKLVLAYQASVRTAVKLMQQSGIPLPVTSSEWIATEIPVHGELVGGVTYYKHGSGYLVDLPSGAVDFDFGSLGEIDGFDAWRLARFAGSEFAKYGFETKEEIETSFQGAVKSGSLVSSGYILYYANELKRTLASEFSRDIPSDSLPHQEQDKVLAVYAHSFLAADLMRENYKKLWNKLDKNNDLSQNDGVNFRIYFSSWLGYLHATCEGFEKLSMYILLTKNRPKSFAEVIPKWVEVVRLIKLHDDPLRELRNNVFHTRVDAKPILQFAADEAGRLSWADELHDSIADFISLYRILCEVHYMTNGRSEESQVRQQNARKINQSRRG